MGLWILFAFINHSCDLKCEALVCGGRDHIPLPGCALAMKQAQGYEAVVSAARVPKAAAFVAELKRSGGGAVESESNLSVYRRIPPVLGDHERSHQLIALTQILAFGYSFLDINIALATSSAKFSIVFLGILSNPMAQWQARISTLAPVASNMLAPKLFTKRINDQRNKEKRKNYNQQKAFD